MHAFVVLHTTIGLVVHGFGMHSQYLMECTTVNFVCNLCKLKLGVTYTFAGPCMLLVIDVFGEAWSCSFECTISWT